MEDLKTLYKYLTIINKIKINYYYENSDDGMIIRKLSDEIIAKLLLSIKNKYSKGE